MSYKKNDILLFMTNEPQAHLCEMFSHETVIKEEIKKEPYYGLVKSVISAKDGIYLMRLGILIHSSFPLWIILTHIGNELTIPPSMRNFSG